MVYYLDQYFSFYREDNPARMLFIQHLVDDRTEGSHSYVEFLQYLKTQVK